MPGREARAACSSSMSAARSMTACCGRFFLPAPHPPADVGQRRPAFLLPPTYFCTSSIFEAGTKIFVPPWNSSSRCSSACCVFSSSFKPAIAADAVRQVDDVVAFAQLEKAVDHAAQPAARRPVQVGAMKQLAAADQRDAVGHQAKAGLQPADRKVQPAGGGQPRRREDLLQPLRFGLGLADDEHVLPAGLAGAHRRRRARRAPWRCRR